MSDTRTPPWPDPDIDPLQWPFFEIPEDHWDCCGEESDPTARLGCAIHLMKTPMHVEAFAVTEVDDSQTAVEGSYGQELLDSIHEHNGYPGEPFYEWTIRGRKYVVVITPFHN